MTTSQRNKRLKTNILIPAGGVNVAIFIVAALEGMPIYAAGFFMLGSTSSFILAYHYAKED